MIKRISMFIVIFFTLIFPMSTMAADIKYAEVFDPKQDKVVKTTAVSQELNTMVTNYIQNLNGIYGKNDPVTDDGYAVRVPLEAPVKVENMWLNTEVNEVFILIPEKEPPFLMIFETPEKLCCFTFNDDISKLSKALDFQLKSK